MAESHLAAASLITLVVVWSSSALLAESGIGVNWGTLSLHKLSPSTVVDLFKDNKIHKVKLFDADPYCMKALIGSGIEVMVGIPNEMLAVLSSSTAASDLWVRQNVSAYMVRGGVNIRYVAVGNEPFLSSYSGQFQSYVIPALLNLQQSLAKANLAGFVKLVVPCNADAYEASLPSQGAFRPELTQIMTQLVSFLNSNGSPFDGANVYYNAFDGNFDTLVAALSKIGYGQMPIVIGEVGWPTDGAISANLTAARAFNQGLIKHVLSNKGTPLRPEVPPMDIYLFSLLDEGAKSILPDPSRDLSGVTNHIKLACSVADCTTLNYGGSCNEIGAKGNISYAFNSYYQLQKQDSQSCDFDGLGMVTFLDPSVGDCRFLVGVTGSNSSSNALHDKGVIVLTFILWGILVFVM
ncbi:hypothetical protein F0562_013502 [Nyssa sinensis]|uniref:X8 domain-containing protein n=1 Tax=Nyssa sinensis TaxID=561372 RepID=A0A5J4ZNH7_9ASTE|nr:hypothetical protein F0562_013502 [Nyssa sinensis]